MSVIILRLHHHEPRALPPSWARRLILDKLAYVLRVTGRRHEYHADYQIPVDEETDAASLDDDPFEFDSQKALYNCESLGSSLLQKLQLELGAFTPPPPQGTKLKRDKNINEPEYNNEVGSDFNSDVTGYSIGHTVMRIGGYLEKLARRSKKSETRGIVQQQWIDMCVVLDRLLLLIFTICLFLDVGIIMYSMTTGTSLLVTGK